MTEQERESLRAGLVEAIETVRKYAVMVRDPAGWSGTINRLQSMLKSIDDPPQTDSDERQSALIRLQELFPLMKQHHPPGWKDFRTPTPPDWRGGLFARIESLPRISEPEDIGYPFRPDYLDCKVLVGCNAVANLISSDLYRSMQIVAGVEGPEGRDPLTRHPHYWVVRFSVPMKEICW